MSVSVKCFALLGLVIAAGTAGAVEFHGVLETRAADVWIDSLLLTLPGGTPNTLPTPGWGSATPATDTFDFPDQPDWPEMLMLYFRVGGSPYFQPIMNPQPQAWLPLLFGAGQVMFYSEVGIYEQPGTGLPAEAFMVRPNIISRRAVFSLQLPTPTSASLELYDAAGNLTRRFDLPAGTHTLTWDGTDAAGKRVAEGIYFCRLSFDGRTAVRKVLVAH